MRRQDGGLMPTASHEIMETDYRKKSTRFLSFQGEKKNVAVI